MASYFLPLVLPRTTSLILVAGLITACSSDDPHARDVRACRSEATHREVEMQGPDNQPTVLTNGYDKSIYERCMRKRGWTDDFEEPVARALGGNTYVARVLVEALASSAKHR